MAELDVAETGSIVKQKIVSQGIRIME